MDLLTSTVDASILYVERNPFSIVFLVLTLWLFGRCIRGQPNSIDNVISEAEKAGYPPIEPLHSFDWETTEPLQFRPFKAKYHLTMALSNLDISTLIPIDKTYRSRLAYRQSLLSKYPSVVIGVTPTAETEGSLAHSAVRELYEFVLGVYLPTRYPGVFDLIDSSSSNSSSSSLGPESSTSDEKEEGGLAETTATTEEIAKYLLNRITNYSIPTRCPTSAREALTTLGTVVDEDFLILLPTSRMGPPCGDEEKKAEEDEYTLQAYTTFYPAGFDTREKLGRTLSAIHDPVPQYKEKLEKSMDRFFARLEVGRFVQRVNWSVTTGTELFAAFGGIHGDTTNDGGEEKGRKDDGVMGSDELNVDDTFLRCERQTLHRLPETKALVFTFHTYTYPIRTVKEEGLGEELAQAIDGLKGGSVPEMWWYKRGAVWGEAVKAYLRG